MTIELAAQVVDRSSPATAAVGLPVDQIPGLLWGFRIHEDGSADPLPLDQPIDNRHDGGSGCTSISRTCVRSNG